MAKREKRRASPVTVVSGLLLGILIVVLVRSCAAPARQPAVEEGKPAAACLPGLMPADVKVNLEKEWGLEFAGPRKGTDLWLDHGEAVDLDTKAVLACDMYENSPGLDVAWVEFMVDASGVAGLVQADTVTALASDYLGYCATIPYQGADPDAARAWIEDNASAAVGEGNVREATIGGVRFRLYGVTWIRTLEVVPAAGD